MSFDLRMGLPGPDYGFKQGYSRCLKMAFELPITGGLLCGCFNGLLKEFARGKPRAIQEMILQTDVVFSRGFLKFLDGFGKTIKFYGPTQSDVFLHWCKVTFP